MSGNCVDNTWSSYSSFDSDRKHYLEVYLSFMSYRENMFEYMDKQHKTWQRVPDALKLLVPSRRPMEANRFGVSSHRQFPVEVDSSTPLQPSTMTDPRLQHADSHAGVNGVRALGRRRGGAGGDRNSVGYWLTPRPAESYDFSLEAIVDAIADNAKLIGFVCGCAIEDGFLDGDFIFKRNRDPVQFDRIQSILRQICREWSDIGIKERDNCYKRLVDKACKLIPAPLDRNNTCILVPGCGMGRLVYDFMWSGFNVVGCEFSVQMLFVANFFMNRCSPDDKFKVAPWLTQRSHLNSSHHTVKQFSVPMYNSTEEQVEGGRCSIHAGDFLEIYVNDTETYDMVVTSYFLDTGSNILRYLMNVFNVLKPGGYLLNFGPLHYHFEISDKSSIELSQEEIMEAIVNIGFIVIEQEEDIEDTYCQNPFSLSKQTFLCHYYVLQKPGRADTC